MHLALFIVTYVTKIFFHIEKEKLSEAVHEYAYKKQKISSNNRVESLCTLKKI